MINHVQCSLAAFSAEFFGSVLPSARLLKLCCSVFHFYVAWRWSSVICTHANLESSSRSPRLVWELPHMASMSTGSISKARLHHVASHCKTLQDVASLWGRDTCACAASSRLALYRQSAGLSLRRDCNDSKRLSDQMLSKCYQDTVVQCTWNRATYVNCLCANCIWSVLQHIQV